MFDSHGGISTSSQHLETPFGKALAILLTGLAVIALVYAPFHLLLMRKACATGPTEAGAVFELLPEMETECTRVDDCRPALCHQFERTVALNPGRQFAIVDEHGAPMCDSKLPPTREELLTIFVGPQRFDREGAICPPNRVCPLEGLSGHFDCRPNWIALCISGLGAANTLNHEFQHHRLGHVCIGYGDQRDIAVYFLGEVVVTLVEIRQYGWSLLPVLAIAALPVLWVVWRRRSAAKPLTRAAGQP